MRRTALLWLIVPVIIAATFGLLALDRRLPVAGTPEAALRGLLGALADLDPVAARGYVCAAQADSAAQLVERFAAFRSLAAHSQDDFALDTAAVTYTLGENTPARVTFLLGGTVTLTAAGRTDRLPAGEVLGVDGYVTVVQEDGWRICDAAS